MSSSAGQKVTTDPATQNSPKNEGLGTVTSDSLAAESVNAGGSFAENSDSRGPSSQPSYSTTTNTTDTSNATKLDSATSSSARSTEPTQFGSAGASGSARDAIANGHSSYAQSVAQPKGQNLQEGGFDSGAPNASFTTDIGGKNDPGRLALNAAQEKNVPSSGGAGPRQGQVTNDGHCAAEENYDLIDHHPNNSQDDLSSSVDEKRQARQKRKRTRHAFSKHGRHVRSTNLLPTVPMTRQYLKLHIREIPSLTSLPQVALTEKEVQASIINSLHAYDHDLILLTDLVSKPQAKLPLLPHEIAQYHMSKSTGLGLGHEDIDDTSVADANVPRFGDDLETEETDARTTGHPGRPCHVPDAGVIQESTTPRNSPPSTQHVASRPPLPRTASASSLISMTMPTQIGYLANRRSASSLHRSFSENVTGHPVTDDGSARAPKRPRAIRLSMDSEGNAIVTTKDTSSPSPPRPQQSILLPEPTSISSPAQWTPMGGAKRTMNGRSRDSRSWEFWCDKDARSELENVAEKDSHGSAAGAIGLLRSASGRSVLGPLNAKRNAPADSHGNSAKRSKLGHKRSSLQRSHTSSGRLQAKPGHTHLPPKFKHSGSATTKRRNGGDSDKENWSPAINFGSDPASDDSNHCYLATLSAPRQSGIRQTLSPNMKARTLRGGVKDPEADPELSSFMAKGRESGEAATADADLDCIQGLLRLSQGSWRR
ncbi:hypothetical protein BST61_g4597 [Cercospora zeina]